MIIIFFLIIFQIPLLTHPQSRMENTLHSFYFHAVTPPYMDLIFLQHNSSSLYSPNFIRQPKHFFLTTSIPLQNRQNRLKQNLNIQSDIPLGNIFCIQADDLFKVCDVASAADLPHSGDSRLDGDSGTVVQPILFQFVGEDGTGSHKAHGASLCQLRNNFLYKKKSF